MMSKCLVHGYRKVFKMYRKSPAYSNSYNFYIYSSETVDTEAQQLNSYHHHSQNSPVIGISRGGTSGVTINTGRTTVTLPSPRHQQQVQQRDRRSLPCQVN